ncbi:MAG: IS200/IS605 family transposase [Verrucomicrobia bacterium]|nr:IS200/IS605 family transposase [Verrucomicrobiota bacterium]
MATYTQIIYHIVFATKDREPVLSADRRRDLFAYMWGVLKKNECHLYRLNGVADHVHILTSLHPTVALADLVKDIKVASSTWIKEGKMFPGFSHWQDGYGAFTYSKDEKDALIEYIKNQEEHHRTETFADEYKRFLKEAGIEFDERHLE